MRIHAIHHVSFEGPGLVAAWAAERGHVWSSTWQHAGDALPDLDAVDALLITGGPMSVGDEIEFPWLMAEKALIAEALRRDIPCLGICLGAQLLAEVLGARVAPMGYKEIGWFPLHRCAEDSLYSWMPDPLLALHWHGDQFDIPASATRLWESALCPHQGFVCGSALALQFHLELGPAHLQALIENAGHELVPRTPGIQDETQMLSQASAFRDAHKVLYRLLDGFFGRD